MSTPARNFRRCTRSAIATARNGISICSIEPCPPIDAVDPTLPPAARSAARKTEGLKLALAKYGFDGLIAGIRRDEEATRAKERVFSPRGTRRRMGRARPAAGILGSVQRLAAAGRAFAHPSDPALDRGRHLGLHASARTSRSFRCISPRTASAIARWAMPTSPFPVASNAVEHRRDPDRARAAPRCRNAPAARSTTKPKTPSSGCASPAISDRHGRERCDEHDRHRSSVRPRRTAPRARRSASSSSAMSITASRRWSAGCCTRPAACPTASSTC